ncbi:hypothetical protein [Halococcus saccharolyticus]|uniref:Uncharacterized protein n=1 Tax=Halococcus saccharolyticus DSM 5350 TaxID=1227455 RepID=M0MFI2_9EURY|nr:hypothetical protein [Halococcus saccharolyticus]EMA43449.1 hypothetical protein C449_15782 [Halococcus saccharolyticus DSM 5350]
MHPILGFNRRNLTALAAATAVLVSAYVLVSHPVVEYGAWLVVFTIWMLWFVLAAVEWLSQADL